MGKNYLITVEDLYSLLLSLNNSRSSNKPSKEDLPAFILGGSTCTQYEFMSSFPGINIDEMILAPKLFLLGRKSKRTKTTRVELNMIILSLYVYVFIVCYMNSYL
jgi:hypothetical protein